MGLLNHIHVFQTDAIPLQVDAKLPGIVFNMKFLTFKSPRQLLIRVLLICDLKMCDRCRIGTATLSLQGRSSTNGN